MDQDVTAGNDATFSVTLSDTFGNELFYWVFNGTDIRADATEYSGLGTRELVVLNVNSDDEGTYSVVVGLGGGGEGFLFSQAATLTICKCHKIYFTLCTYCRIVLFSLDSPIAPHPSCVYIIIGLIRL